MIVKSTLLAVIVFLGSLAVAGAQSSSEVVSGGETGVTVAAGLGWNYVHATTCYISVDGSTTWLSVYPQEGGIWFTSNPVFQSALTPACQSGNWIGFNVFNLNGLLWNALITFTYK